MKSQTAWADVNEQVRLDDAILDAANGAPASYGAVTPVPAAGRRPVHGAIRPADVRPGDPISARARLSSARQQPEVDVQVWRISPLGVELVRPAGVEVAAGSAIDLTLRIGADVLVYTRLGIDSAHLERGRELLSARFADADEAKGDRACRRIGARWRCQADYLPTGIARCQVRYADFVHFRVAEISRSGMQLLTSPRNKFLVPGVTLQATCTFPMIGQLELELRVVHARVRQENGRDVLALGVVWSTGARAHAAIGEYLLHFGPGASPEQLRAEGFPVRSTARAFDFGFVRSEAEYREVLALRRAAYVHARKAPPDTTDEQMADELDARSRIITARYQGRLVGSIRVMFPRTDTDRLRHDDYCALPPTLPPRTELIESSKACTDPAFRKGELFYSLLKHAALVTVQARRRYIFMSCTEGMRRVYRKLGFVDVGAVYVHPTIASKHHVMIGDAVSMIAGGMNPVLWNLAVGPELWAYAKRCGVVPSSPWLDLRVRALRLLAPLAWVARRVGPAREAR